MCAHLQDLWFFVNHKFDAMRLFKLIQWFAAIQFDVPKQLIKPDSHQITCLLAIFFPFGDVIEQ